VEVLAEGGKQYLPDVIRSTVRPANIGAGLWKSTVELEATSIASGCANISKIAKGAGYAAIGLDVGFGIYDNMQIGASSERVFSDAVIDTAFGFGGLGASMGAGALYGSVFPGAGNVAGAAIGLGFGLVYMVVTEVIQPGGESLKGRSQNWFKQEVIKFENDYHYISR
jgi:hypothetical protein